MICIEQDLGSRFKKAGYNCPKYMIEAKGKTLFDWSISMCVCAYRNSVMQIRSHYYPVGHFHGLKIRRTVFRDSGSSLLPSSSFLLLEPFFHPVLFSATKIKLLLIVLPEADVFCIFLRQRVPQADYTCDKSRLFVPMPRGQPFLWLYLSALSVSRYMQDEE